MTIRTSDTEKMGPEPPVSASVAVPIGFDSEDTALPEAKALPIVGSTAPEADGTEPQIDDGEEEPTPVPDPSRESAAAAPEDKVAPATSRCTRKQKWCCCSIVAILAVVGVIVGVLFGSRKGQMLLKGYPDCRAHVPLAIGDGFCDGEEYNTAECGWDGGDCVEFNEQYPNCHVDYPYFIGDGFCDGGEYNSAECDWDGGDCVEFNEQYPGCFVDDPWYIGDGQCDGGEYISAECDWDGGDCVEFKEQYPGCFVDSPWHIGDGFCDVEEYNSAECGWDGGDCVVNGYPDCHVENPQWIGDGACDDLGEHYNTAECGWDGGDCLFSSHWPKACTGTIGSTWADKTRSWCQQKCIDEGDACEAFDFNDSNSKCRLFTSYSSKTADIHRSCFVKK